jgi:hypothetical protein
VGPQMRGPNPGSESLSQGTLCGKVAAEWRENEKSDAARNAVVGLWSAWMHTRTS